MVVVLVTEMWIEPKELEMTNEYRLKVFHQYTADTRVVFVHPKFWKSKLPACDYKGLEDFECVTCEFADDARSQTWQNECALKYVMSLNVSDSGAIIMHADSWFTHKLLRNIEQHPDALALANSKQLVLGHWQTANNWHWPTYKTRIYTTLRLFPEIQIIGGWADIFYIPKPSWQYLLPYFTAFREIGVMNEIAWPSSAMTVRDLQNMSLRNLGCSGNCCRKNLPTTHSMCGHKWDMMNQTDYIQLLKSYRPSSRLLRRRLQSSTSPSFQVSSVCVLCFLLFVLAKIFIKRQ